jgi:hypothetical protein
MAGRPTKLTPERRDDLTLMLAHGVPVGEAAKDVRERIAEIRSAHRTGDGAASEARMVVLLLKASKHDWRASAWWLERRWPKRWALRDLRAVE